MPERELAVAAIIRCFVISGIVVVQKGREAIGGIALAMVGKVLKQMTNPKKGVQVPLREQTGHQACDQAICEQLAHANKKEQYYDSVGSYTGKCFGSGRTQTAAEKVSFIIKLDASNL